MSATINSILSHYDRHKSKLIPILQEIQREFGYVSPEALVKISRHLRISENQIFGVSSFFSQFRFSEPGRHSLKICMGTACHVRGAADILDECERRLGVKAEETTEDRLFTLETVNCVGACALGPIVVLDDDYHGQMQIRTANELIEKYRPAAETEGGNGKS